jgi:hypothetical protein
MAIEFAEGWDPVASNGTNISTFPEYGWNCSIAQFDISTTDQRNGLACLSFHGFSFNGEMTYSLPSTSPIKTIRFAYKQTVVDTDLTIGCGLKTTSGSNILVAYSTTVNSFELWANNVLIFTTDTIYPRSVYYHHEFAVNRTTGAYEWRIDGNVITSGSGLSGTDFDRIVFTNGSGGSSRDGIYFWDDISVSDAWEFLGDCVVDYDFPDADTANADWTPASGTDGFAMVDNSPPIPAQYIETSTINDISDFDVADPVPVIYQVFGVLVVSNALRTGASTEEYNTRLIQNSAVAAGGTHVAPQTTAGWTRDLFLTNPDTGLAWTPSDVLGISVGVEKTT